MNRRLGFHLGLAAGALLSISSAFAAPLPFTDGFEGFSSTQLNTPPDGWAALFGTVDSVHSGDYSITCASGSGCVDLDGSTKDSALLLSSDTFDLHAGQQYQLTFDLSGNQRNSSSDSVNFGINDAITNGQLAFGTTTVAGGAGFTTYSLIFTAATDAAAYIFFSSFGANNNDNVGAVLDNVSLTAVPIPAAGWLLISGLVGLVGVARRRKSGGAMEAVAAA